MAIVLAARTDDAVLSVIETWVGLLVERQYEEALALLATPRPLLEPAEASKPWSAELLATVILNYGFVEPREVGEVFSVTPTSTATGSGPRFEVKWFEKPVGCGWGASVGHAHYDLPLSGEWSDVTATFDILDTPEGLVLALEDVHVM
jgi:hypothetical protein